MEDQLNIFDGVHHLRQLFSSNRSSFARTVRELCDLLDEVATCATEADRQAAMPLFGRIMTSLSGIVGVPVEEKQRVKQGLMEGFRELLDVLNGQPPETDYTDTTIP